MIAPDKIKHVIAGLITFAVFYFAVAPFASAHGYELSLGWGIVFAAFVGWAKERLYDWYRKKKHAVDKTDAWFTAGGGIIGFIISVIL